MQTETTGKQRRLDLKRFTILALLTAIAYLSIFVIKLKLFGFLSYEAKDVFITLGGFLYGPLAAILISVVTSLLELPTSDTGIIGFVMNALSSVFFSATASWIYHKKRSLLGAILGLICGVFAMTAAMLLWNYLITPLYLHIPRHEVAGMLTTVFLPFNLLKAGLNAALLMLVYKPFTRVLRQMRLLPERQNASNSTKATIVVWSLSLLIIAACIVSILKINGVF